jgi:hypothetical protein
MSSTRGKRAAYLVMLDHDRLRDTNGDNPDFSEMADDIAERLHDFLDEEGVDAEFELWGEHRTLPVLTLVCEPRTASHIRRHDDVKAVVENVSMPLTGAGSN